MNDHRKLKFIDVKKRVENELLIIINGRPTSPGDGGLGVSDIQRVTSSKPAFAKLFFREPTIRDRFDGYALEKELKLSKNKASVAKRCFIKYSQGKKKKTRNTKIDS